MEAGLGLMLLCPLLQGRVRRIQIFPLFEDYDRMHIGSVTRSQVGDLCDPQPSQYAIIKHQPLTTGCSMRIFLKQLFVNEILWSVHGEGGEELGKKCLAHCCR